MANLVNTIGLALDALGAFMIWKFAFSASRADVLPRHRWYEEKSSEILGPDTDSGKLLRGNIKQIEAEERDWSVVGFTALISGFALQAVSGWLQ